MNLTVWNYLKTSLVVVIQAILVTILLGPWLQLAQQTWVFSLASAQIWVFCTTILGINLLYSKENLPLLVLGLIVPPLWAFLGHLPLLVFLPLSIILFYLGIRFADYPKRRSFALDWAWGSLLLVVTGVFESKLGYQVGLAQTLVYFALGMVALIIWNTKALEEEGLTPDYGGLGGSITIFVAIVGSLALVLALILSPEFLQMVVALLGKVYALFADALLLFVVKPFAWFLSPLFNWIEHLEKHDLTIDLPEMERVPLEHSALEQGINPTATKVLGWGGWLIFTLLLALALWFMIRRIVKKSKNAKVNPVVEQRESVYSRAEVLADLKGALQSLIKPLTRLGQAKWYRGQDPLLLIRTYYARFVVHARKSVPFEQSTTPLEYACKLSSENEELSQEALTSLTTYYNHARYGEQGDEEAVKATEKAFRQL